VVEAAVMVVLMGQLEVLALVVDLFWFVLPWVVKE
jgi:hypothetical protein